MQRDYLPRVFKALFECLTRATREECVAVHLLGVALPEATLHTARGTGWTCSDRGLPGNVGTPADPVKLAQSV